jgi:hypothetical protein
MREYKERIARNEKHRKQREIMGESAGERYLDPEDKNYFKRASVDFQRLMNFDEY